MNLLANLRRSLHDGEAQAIALALELNADIVLIDQTDGRIVAQSYGLTITGTLGILLKAQTLGYIEQLKPLMEKLQSEARFFIAPALFQKILLLAGE